MYAVTKHCLLNGTWHMTCGHCITTMTYSLDCRADISWDGMLLETKLILNNQPNCFLASSNFHHTALRCASCGHYTRYVRRLGFKCYVEVDRFEECNKMARWLPKSLPYPSVIIKAGAPPNMYVKVKVIFSWLDLVSAKKVNAHSFLDKRNSRWG